MLLPSGETLLEAVVNRLSIHNNLTPVLLTTLEPADDQLVSIAENAGIQYFRGDESNVLKRFIDAGEHFNVANSDFVLRICADNPYLSHEIIDLTIDSCMKNPEFDYISFGWQGKPGIKHHTGIFIEALKINALQTLLPKNNLLYNEHVTIGLYENPNIYQIKILDIPTDWQPEFEKIRLTIDDNVDWAFCLETYPVINKMSFSEQRILLLSKKSWVTLMGNQINKYQK